MKKIAALCLVLMLSVQAQAKLNVVVSIPPQIEFVKAIGQNQVQVTCLLPPGTSDELFEPKPNSLKQLSQAHLYIQIGTLGFEKQYAKTWQSLNPRLVMVNTSKGIPLHEADPHVWMSVRYAMQQVELIYQALCKADPTHGAFYEHNKQNYLHKLNALDRALTQSLATHTGKAFLIFHPALGYFARDYGLRQIGVEEEGKSPTPKQLKNILTLAKKEHITLILAEEQSPKELAALVSKHVKGQLVLFNPLSEHYLDSLARLQQAFRF